MFGSHRERMIELHSFGFPVSIVMFIISVLIGVGLTVVTFGAIGFGLIILLSYMGVIRILPLAERVQELLYLVWPKSKEIKKILKETYTVKGTAAKTPAIYLFHPHGSFSTSYFFHQMARLTNWPKEAYAKCTVTHHFFWIPFGEEVLDAFHAIPNRYRDMKTVLEEGDNLAVIPGGVKEMNYVKDRMIIVHLSGRKGIFRLALETGTPLVPVLSYGENELYQPTSFAPVQWLNTKVEEWFGMQLCIPSLSSIQKWMRMISEGGTARKVETVIGPALEVEQCKEPTIKQIETLKENYILALRTLYAETKPEEYASELQVV